MSWLQNPIVIAFKDLLPAGVLPGGASQFFDTIPKGLDGDERIKD